MGSRDERHHGQPGWRRGGETHRLNSRPSWSPLAQTRSQTMEAMITAQLDAYTASYLLLPPASSQPHVDWRWAMPSVLSIPHKTARLARGRGIRHQQAVARAPQQALPSVRGQLALRSVCTIACMAWQRAWKGSWVAQRGFRHSGGAKSSRHKWVGEPRQPGSGCCRHAKGQLEENQLRQLRLPLLPLSVLPPSFPASPLVSVLPWVAPPPLLLLLLPPELPGLLPLAL